MAQDNVSGKGSASSKGGGGDRAYMTDFASGRSAAVCQSCGINMRRAEDFGSESDGAPAEHYCAVCYVEGAFAHEAATSDVFISAAVQDLAKARGQAVGKMRLTLRKELPKLERWAG